MPSARSVPHRVGRSAARAYLAAFLPTDACEAALDDIAATFDRGLVDTLGAAHEALLRAVRVTPEAAGFTLVAEGGLPVRDAARVAGVRPRELRRIVRSELAAPTPPREAARRPAEHARARGTARQLLGGVAVPAAAVAIGIAGLAVLPRGATATGPVALIQDPDRGVVVSVVTDVEPEEVLPGGELEVTVAVMNGGSASARDVVVVSQLPDEAVYVDGSSRLALLDASGGGSSPRSADPPAGGVDVGEVPAGATAELSYAATVAGDAGDGARLPVVSSAQVEGFGRVTSSPATATVVRRAELEVSLTSDPGARVPAGRSISWQVRIRNVGTDTAQDVRVHWRPAIDEGTTDVGAVGPGEERTVTVDAAAPASAGRELRQRVEVVHADGRPVSSETIVMEVVGAHLADTGVAAVPTAALGASLLAAGWALLRRSSRGRP